MAWSKKEEEYLKENYGNIKVKDLSIYLNKPYANITHKAFRMGLYSNIKYQIRNTYIIKQIENLGFKIIGEYRGVKEKTIFLCPFCRKEFITTPQKIATKHTRSCGCTSNGKRSGTKYLSGTFLNRWRRGAIARNINIKISDNELEQKLIEQDFKCALSGLKLITGYIPLIDITASIDRIDSSKEYSIDNIQWVHKDINMMKQSYTQEQFINYCRMVVKNAELPISY